MAITYNNLYMDIRQEPAPCRDRRLRRSRRGSWCASPQGKRASSSCATGGSMSRRTWSEQARALMRRHLAGEPLAYLIGEWEFYGLPLDISEQVLIPRSDTEVLAGEAIRWLQTQQDARVLDLCAGSGCVGLAVASQVHACRVVLGEKSEAALQHLPAEHPP